MGEKRVITLYLSTWQKRMIKDFMPKLKSVSKIRLDLSGTVNAPLYMQRVMYKLPDPFAKKATWNLYLTDEQIAQVALETDTKLDFSALNIPVALNDCREVMFE